MNLKSHMRYNYWNRRILIQQLPNIKCHVNLFDCYGVDTHGQTDIQTEMAKLIRVFCNRLFHPHHTQFIKIGKYAVLREVYSKRIVL